MRHTIDFFLIVVYIIITNFDLPAKVFIPSVALGKIVGVLGNEARMVISYMI